MWYTYKYAVRHVLSGMAIWTCHGPMHIYDKAMCGFNTAVCIKAGVPLGLRSNRGLTGQVRRLLRLRVGGYALQ